MEMRANRSVIARQYLPWDPLQLSEKIDSGRRVRKNHVSFRPFRAFKKQLLWSALTDLNFACITDKEDLRRHYLAQLLPALSPLQESISVSCYSLGDTFEEELTGYDDAYAFVTYHSYGESLSHLLTQLLAHRKTIRNKTAEVSSLEAENKELQFIFLFLTAEQTASMLSQPLMKNMLTSLLQESGKERMYICLFAPPVEAMGRSFLDDFSQVYFLGQEASARAHEVLYPEWPVTANSYSQELVGFGIFTPREELVSLHWPTFTLSEWGEDFRAKRQEEEELYREFLNSKVDR